jgi:UDP-galactopyranose mutase
MKNPINSDRVQHSSGFTNDLICLSHLRWDFVFQRPQHLLTRAAADRRVFYVEEPIYGDFKNQTLEVSQRDSGVWVVQPHLPKGLSHDETVHTQMHLIDDLLSEYEINEYVVWYYTPMALSFTRHLNPAAIVYDCMDELSLFKHAPKELVDNERELFRIADLVFTGGQSLYEAKKDLHQNVYAFPSSIDFAHFSHARRIAKGSHEAPDQAEIPHPRMGYCGVIDERLDLELLAGVADARPDWHLIMIGPIVKIDPESLPKRPNIHYLGPKQYNDLPQYLAGWDVAMMPFALNDSTRFISPTKTPEYLAAGKTVVSTSIRDVVRPYGEMGLVEIADTVADFIRAAAKSGMDERTLSEEWLSKVDAFLAQTSWDKTWAQMCKLITDKVQRHELILSETSEEKNPEALGEKSKESSFLSNNNTTSGSFSPQVA